MAPDAEKHRIARLTGENIGIWIDSVWPEPCEDLSVSNAKSLEVVYQQRINDFSYVERPLRCLISCEGGKKNLTCNQKSAIYLATGGDMSINDLEFTLTDEEDYILIQDTKLQRFVCSNGQGVVYTSATRHEGMEKWVLSTVEGFEGEFFIESVASGEFLACIGNSVCTVAEKSGKTSWKIDLTSGELGFLSLAKRNLQLRCDLAGQLSMSKNCLGWEAWRLSEAGEGYIRISPWAHADLFLFSNENGDVYTTHRREQSDRWSIEQAPDGQEGIVIKSAKTGRLLVCQDKAKDPVCTLSPSVAIGDEVLWDFQSLNKFVYYFSSADGTGKRLEGTKRGNIGTRNMPIRLQSEEWKIEPTKDEGVVRLFSNGASRYLSSTENGEVCLLTSPDENGSSDKWIIEQREQGSALTSYQFQRVLVCTDNGCAHTVLPGTPVAIGCIARWRLEPKTPRQVNKHKVQALGTAIAIGVATTVATPFVIGGAIGIIGVTQVGVAGQVAIGGIRAAEAISSITRLTARSSDLIARRPSVADSKSHITGNDRAISNRPFCSWRSW